jgi:ABC-type cobalt transport system, ATPase component
MPIELRNASYTYDLHIKKIAALGDVSLTINDGEFVGVMGHTGCGKSTLIQLMSGLLAPSNGSVILDGEDINAKHYDRRTLRKKVGIVFQYPEYQLFETTVEKDVAFGLKHSGMTAAEIESHVKDALELMESSFDDIRHKSPLALSGGEKRRAAIAGVLATRPKFLIFDEPVAGLDPKKRESFLRTVTRLNEAGTAIIMVSHNADALAETAGRIIVLNEGSMISDGSVKRIFTEVTQNKIEVSTPLTIARMLSQRGVNIPADTVTYDELLSAVTSHLRGDGGAT